MSEQPNQGNESTESEAPKQEAAPEATPEAAPQSEVNVEVNNEAPKSE